MNDAQYPDLFQDAAWTAAREIVEVAPVIAALARAYLQHRARAERTRAVHDEQAKRALQAQERAERDAARQWWAPANDPQWLRAANLTDTTAAWCAAVHYADPATASFEPSAAAAVEHCEARLRELHPHMMTRYDRLREDGLERVEAMRETAPLLMRSPNVREHGGRARLALTNQGLGHPWVDAVHGPGREGFDAHVAEVEVARGKRIIGTLQARARAEGRSPLSEDEQRTFLEATTNLPPELIRRAVTPAAPPKRRPWEQDFPFPIQHVVAVTRVPESSAPAVPRNLAQRVQRPERAAGS